MLIILLFPILFQQGQQSMRFANTTAGTNNQLASLIAQEKQQPSTPGSVGIPGTPGGIGTPGTPTGYNTSSINTQQLSALLSSRQPPPSPANAPPQYNSRMAGPRASKCCH